ncbi:MAG: SsrA-binding protein SmpB [bacterium]
MADKEESGEGLIATNRKARYDYTILDTYEAGLVLKGTEVKSLRNGKATLADGYAMLNNGELWLIGMHISPYEQGSYSNVDPIRSRKLLLHKTEIRKLAGKMQQKGLALVPLKMYFKNNVAKILIGLAQGKKSYDKRADIAEREIKRDLKRKYAR